MKTTDFARHLSDFLKNHLPKIRKLSENTVKSYCDAFRALLTFAEEKYRINPDKFEMSHLTKDFVYDFLQWLDGQKSNSASTRKQRLAAVRVFVNYIQTRVPECLFECQKILELRVRRIKEYKIKYLTADELKILLAMPALDNEFDRRDSVLLSLLYDAALRVQEICDLTVGDVRLEKPSAVRVLGKGQKVRSVQIEKETTSSLAKYLREHNLLLPEHFQHPVFFNHKGEKLTRAGVAYILRKYWEKVCFQHSGFAKKISPHMLRHSKAMHMRQAGVELVKIRDFLGHESIVTTENYAHADIETKRIVVEKVAGATTKLPDWTQDESLMSMLTNLCR